VLPGEAAPKLLSRPLPTRRPIVGGVAAAAALLLAVVVLPAATALPPTVARVTVVNPHPWNAEVRVDHVDVGTVVHGNSETFRDVLDAGASWRFRFRYAGTTTDLVVTRQALADAGWTVAVPETFADDLEATGTASSA
jgi:hypothetical protein